VVDGDTAHISRLKLSVFGRYNPLVQTNSYADDRSLYSTGGTGTRGGMKKPLLDEGVGLDRNGAAVELVTVPALGAE
jgi:hypothetical protein